jgi:hypothetical protein
MEATPNNNVEERLRLFTCQLADIIMSKRLWDPTKYQWTIT